MRVYITRHGQIAAANYFGDAAFPVGDPPLSALGREQAHLLGARLREWGFAGIIYASPYYRTMETAQIAAEYTGAAVYPYAPLRERLKTVESAAEFRGLSLAELKEQFAAVAPEAVLTYPWWSETAEVYGQVRERVVRGISQLKREREVLFVTHASPGTALLNHYGIHSKPMECFYNCSLSVVDPESSTVKPRYSDVSFMPYDKVTNNFRSRKSMEDAYLASPYEGDIALPGGFDSRGRYLLHIGDTLSRDYPYYRALIEKVSPEVIVHTGDLADEVKVGRIPGTEGEYFFKLGKLLEILGASAARRVILVPGNNDLPREMAQMAPFAEVVRPGARFQEGRFHFQVTHIGAGKESDADFMLYGHSLRNENWSFEQNRYGKPCRFNAKWGSCFIDLDSGAFYSVNRP